MSENDSISKSNRFKNLPGISYCKVGPETTEVTLTRGYVAIIDTADLEIVSKYRWHVTLCAKRPYAARHERLPNGKKKCIFMHREILKCDGLIDHVNGDALDNRRANIRPCTKAQNSMNSGAKRTNKTGFKGVARRAGRTKWSARIYNTHLGTFDTPEEAALAYNEAAKKMFGEFAWLNPVTPSEAK